MLWIIPDGNPANHLRDRHVGYQGFEVNNPEQKYELRSMDGKFSGLHLLCIMYVGSRLIAPESTPSFDLATEYDEAKAMFERKQRQ